jgi:hypothetical protein
MQERSGVGAVMQLPAENAPRRRRRRGTCPQRIDAWEFTDEFIDVWLDDYYVRSQDDPGLLEQMDDLTRFEYGLSVTDFTEQLVASLRGAVA